MVVQKQAGMNAMETKAKNPWVAGILSGVLPGLGQFYNRQLGKGAGFLIGFLVLAGVLVFGGDLQAPGKARGPGARAGNPWLILAGGGAHAVPGDWGHQDPPPHAQRAQPEKA